MAYYEQYETAVKEASKKYGVNEKLIWAVIEQESGGDSAAVSSAGAAGLMQLMPATALQYGVKDRTDPTQNIMGGTALLSDLLDRYDGDTESALAAYYAGPTNVSVYGKETYKDYYTGILSKMDSTGGTSYDAPETENTLFGMGNSGLVWWGDIVLIVLILLCVLLAVVFIYLAINGGMPDPAEIVKGMIK